MDDPEGRQGLSSIAYSIPCKSPEAFKAVQKKLVEYGVEPHQHEPEHLNIVLTGRDAMQLHRHGAIVPGGSKLSRLSMAGPLISMRSDLVDLEIYESMQYCKEGGRQHKEHFFVRAQSIQQAEQISEYFVFKHERNPHSKQVLFNENGGVDLEIDPSVAFEYHLRMQAITKRLNPGMLDRFFYSL